MSTILLSIMCDRRAATLFVFAAACVIPLTVLLGLSITPAYDQLASGLAGSALFAFVTTLAWVMFVLSAIVTFFGMITYLLVIDQKSWKLGWLVVFVLTSSFGAAIYCLMVYRTQSKAFPGTPGQG